MRLHIIRALFRKEAERHLANRGGIALGLLLIAAAVLLSVFRPGGGDAGATGMVGGVHHCYVEYHGNDWFIAALRDSVPDELKAQVVFRRWATNDPDGAIIYSPGTGGIHLRTDHPTDPTKIACTIWHPKGDPQAMAPYEAWFWKEAHRAFAGRAAEKLKAAGGDPSKVTPPDVPDDDQWAVRSAFARLEKDAEAARQALPSPADRLVPMIAVERLGLGGKVLDVRSAVATGLVVFALYFTCVYLLPTLNCEERERGVLLAQALSPASPAEILAAKFLFYPLAGGGLAAVLAGVFQPAVLTSFFFWLSLGAVAAGFLGIGMTVATLAKTQRAAFLGAMCYLMSVSMVLIICSVNGIPGIPHLALEYHVPRILHASLSGEVQSFHYLHLLAAYGLAAAWLTAAGWLFRRRGWQ